MVRLNSVWTFATVLSLFGLGNAKANAQTKFPFEAVYETQVILRPIPNTDVSETFVTGVSDNAPYGLTNLTSKNYSRFNPQTSVITFGPDPTAFGLEGFEPGTDVLFGGGDRLFGTSNATAVLGNGRLSGSGTVRISGGSGRFQGATGILEFIENNEVNPDPTAPIVGEAILRGSFQVPQSVPEPKTTTTLLSVGVIIPGLLVQKHRRKTISRDLG